MDELGELVLWTAGSIGLWTIGVWVAWFAAQRPASLAGRFRTGWSGNPVGFALRFLVRLIFYLLIPYLALLRHVLSPVSIGLAGTEAELPWWNLGWASSDWAGALGWVIGLGGIAAVVLVAGWWNAHRAMLAQDRAAQDRAAQDSVRGSFPAGGMIPAPSIFSLVPDVVFAEAHWAFYRAVPLALVSDPYWATLAGGALVIVEWALDPGWHASIRDGSQREAVLMQLGWLALSSTVFVMTHNVWVALLAHFVLAWGVGQWVVLLAWRRAMISQP